MCSLYSTEQNDFEIEGQEWSVLTRQFKDSHFHNNVTDSDSQSLTQNAVIFYTVMLREIFQRVTSSLCRKQKPMLPGINMKKQLLFTP